MNEFTPDESGDIPRRLLQIKNTMSWPNAALVAKPTTERVVNFLNAHTHRDASENLTNEGVNERDATPSIKQTFEDALSEQIVLANKRD